MEQQGKGLTFTSTNSLTISPLHVSLGPLAVLSLAMILVFRVRLPRSQFMFLSLPSQPLFCQFMSLFGFISFISSFFSFRFTTPLRCIEKIYNKDRITWPRWCIGSRNIQLWRIEFNDGEKGGFDLILIYGWNICVVCIDSDSKTLPGMAAGISYFIEFMTPCNYSGFETNTVFALVLLLYFIIIIIIIIIIIGCLLWLNFSVC